MHQPLGHGAVGVQPEQVSIAVAVEVADACDTPRRVGPDRDPARVEICRADDVGGMQLPFGKLAGHRVAPDQVGVVVAVEVAHADDRPARIRRDDPERKKPLTSKITTTNPVDTIRYIAQ